MGTETFRVLAVVALLAWAGAIVSGCQASPQDDLNTASSSCDLPAVRSALAAGATVNPKGPDDFIPLLGAAGSGCADVVHALLAAGANVNAESDGVTALDEGAEGGDPQVIKALIAAGAKGLNAPGRSGLTLLYQIAADGKLANVKALISNGADVNSKNVGGETPLFAAAQYGLPEMAQLLVSSGADVSVRNSLGETALRVALDPLCVARWGTPKGHADVAAILRAHGAAT
jgi:uncharacterized protein